MPRVCNICWGTVHSRHCAIDSVAATVVTRLRSVSVGQLKFVRERSELTDAGRLCFHADPCGENLSLALNDMGADESYFPGQSHMFDTRLGAAVFCRENVVKPIDGVFISGHGTAWRLKYINDD